MKRSIPWAVAAVLVTVLAGIALCKAEPETDTNFENYKPLAAAIRKADRVVLYEGLPHPGWENEAYERELKSKKTVKFHDWPFYAKPLPLSEKDGKALTKVFTTASNFTEFAGEKKCGGFHPDYCIEWHVGKEIYRSLVCFGCGEVKVYGPRLQLRCDGGKDFGKVLKSYHNERPELKREE